MPIHIITKTKDHIEVTTNLKNMSPLLMDMLDDDPDSIGGNFTINRETHIIKYCVRFCDLYITNPYTWNTGRMLPQWTVEWLSGIASNDLCELVCLAHYLDIEVLYRTLTYQIANIIKQNKTPEDVRKVFKITDDFTQEEKINFTNLHQWVYDNKL